MRFLCLLSLLLAARMELTQSGKDVAGVGTVGGSIAVVAFGKPQGWW